MNELELQTGLQPQLLAYAFGGPLGRATIKALPEDFLVEELLGFEPDGEGEHVFLYIEKRQLNTQDVVEQLARLSRVKSRDIGFSGLKDKQAVTRQWFSVYLPGKQAAEPQWQQLNNDKLSVLQLARHCKKLRRGVHQANAFTILLRNCDFSHEAAHERLAQLPAGVPNYFGSQRFGKQGNNLLAAQRWFSGASRAPKKPAQRSLYLSAARSYLFNCVLDARVADASWCQYLAGDILMLSGTNSQFSVDAWDAVLAQRLASGDIHISGPMVGESTSRGNALSAESALPAALRLEKTIIGEHGTLAAGLEAQRVKAQRRALRMMPGQFASEWLDSVNLQLRFSLPSGCFATMLLRELADVSEANQ